MSTAFEHAARADQQQCLTRPVYSSILTGGIITGISAVSQGMGPHLPVQFAQNVGFIYGYHVLQCPMEALHGRQSAWVSKARKQYSVGQPREHQRSHYGRYRGPL